MQLKPDAPQLTWQGAVSLQKTDGLGDAVAHTAPDACPIRRAVTGTLRDARRRAYQFSEQYNAGFGQYRATERKRDAGSLL